MFFLNNKKLNLKKKSKKKKIFLNFNLCSYFGLPRDSVNMPSRCSYVIDCFAKKLPFNTATINEEAFRCFYRNAQCFVCK